MSFFFVCCVFFVIRPLSIYPLHKNDVFIDCRTVRVWLKRDSGSYWPSIVNFMPSQCSAVGEFRLSHSDVDN